MAADDAESCRQRGNALYREGDHVGAERAYGAALAAAGPGTPAAGPAHEAGQDAIWRATVLANRAQTRLQLGWIKGALADCRDAVALDAANWKARLRMVKALEARLDFAEALEACEELCARLATLPVGVQQLVLRKRAELKAMKRSYKPPPLSEMERRALFSEHHTLRLFLGDSSLDAAVTAGSTACVEIATFIGNEFGLLDRKMLPTTPTIRVSVVGPAGICFEVEELVSAGQDHGRATLRGTLSVAADIPAGQLFQLRMSANGVEPVLTPPALVTASTEAGAAHADRFAPYGGCRELSLPSQHKTLYLLEATSTLGIAGKLWDSAARMLGLLQQERFANLIEERRVLELGAGTGAVGVGCALLGAGQVSVTDLAEVVPQMEANIVLNAVNNARAMPLAWGKDGSAQLETMGDLDVVILSDVVYDPELYELLLWTLEKIAVRSPDMKVLWGHRHRNPADHRFFAIFATLFDVRLADGPGAAFLVPPEAMTPELEALQQVFRQPLEPEADNTSGSWPATDAQIPTHASRDVSIYLCRPRKKGIC